MKLIGSLFGIRSPKTMGKQYMKVGRNALFGLRTDQRDSVCTEKVPEPLSLLISKNGRLKHGRVSAIFIGILTLVIGIILSSIPWVDYVILKILFNLFPKLRDQENIELLHAMQQTFFLRKASTEVQLRLWNGSLSFHYWQKPGVVRLTKVYIFNVTNTENFLQFNEKPKLQEIGPFVYREDMEKVNIVFHNNGTVSYQHKKILNFVPELSKDKDVKLMVPNIPLLTLTTQSKSLPRFLTVGLSVFLSGMHMSPFVPVTAQELVFGYDDPLVSIAHRFFPKTRRPMSQMGLLLGRNGTLNEVSTIFTGHTDMKEFGLLNRLNGLDRLPYWADAPCNSIRASEGSFFPPREKTGADIIHLWDKDICRTLPLQYRGPTEKSGIKADFYTPSDVVFGRPNETAPENECFCSDDMSTCPSGGLQNISPCQYTAPVYLSFPHFYKSDRQLLDAVEGLNPNAEMHETYFKIQSKLGVPLEGKVRLQLNLKVERQPYIGVVSDFPDIVFPVMWLEEGIEELTPSIRRWVYLATTFSDIAVPCASYGLILVGIIIIVTVFAKAYNNTVFTHEAIELGKKTIRRGSMMLVNGQHKFLAARESYVLLSYDNNKKPARTEV